MKIVINQIMRGKLIMDCAFCGIKACKNNEENMAQNCPNNKKEELSKIKEIYQTEENFNIAKVAAELSVPQGLTRIEETMEFARRLGYKKLGLAFCNALSNEAKTIANIFKYHGFEVESIMCKVGSISREIVELEKSGMPMCNPIAQAKFLNEAKTDLNVVVGLCIGHDSLFFKYSEAPVTVLAVKDRILAHNPLGAVYLSESAYKKKMYPPKD